MSENHTFDKSILRIADVAQILSVSVPTLYRWQRESLFPQSIKYGPKCAGWPRHVVEDWLEAKQKAQSNDSAQ